MRTHAVVLVCALEAGAAAAQEFKRTSVPGEDSCLIWNQRDFTYNVDAAGSSATPGDTEFEAIDASFATWQALSDSCSDFHFIKGPRLASVVAGHAAGSDTTNVVVFRETNCRTVPPKDPCRSDATCGNKYRCWDYGDGTIALTTTTFSTRTGVITDADIELNAAPGSQGVAIAFTTVNSPPCSESAQSSSCVATDVQNTVTHEIGHVLGLDHVDAPASTMAATASIGETSKRLVDFGTATGFCEIYPREQPATSCDQMAALRRRIIARNIGTAGLEGLGCTAAGAGQDWLLLAFLALVGALGEWPRRRGHHGTPGSPNQLGATVATVMKR